MVDFPSNNGIHGVTPVSRLDTGRAGPGKKEANPMIEKTAPTDVVQISADALIKSRLSAFAAAVNSEIKTISPERMRKLKQDYAGDNCPVSAYDVAGAIIAGRVMEDKTNE
jgi:hypothetical protein